MNQVSPTAPSALQSVIDAQDGIVHRRQLIDAGMTRGELRWRLHGQWRFVVPGVVATFTGRLDTRQWLIAAALHGGPDAVITSTTAARWRGLQVSDNRTIHLSVSVNQYSRSVGRIHVRRTRYPDKHAWHRGPLTIASPARCIAEAARDAPTSRDAAALVVDAVHRGVTTAEDLQRELEYGPRAGSAYLRRGLDAVMTAAWSVPEHDLARVVRRSRVLPEPWLNPRSSWS